MKKILTTNILVALSTVAMMLSGCVSMNKFERLESQYGRNKKELSLMRGELEEMRAENAELLRQNQSLSSAMADMEQVKGDNETLIAQLKEQVAAMQQQYDTTMENYIQQISGQNRDLTKANRLLTQRTKELNEKEASFRTKEAEFKERERVLRQQREALEVSGAQAQKALEDKKKELEAIRSTVAQALVGFADKGLDVTTHEGKVYVSMDDKLMFASGSWTISKEGVRAIEELAAVLEEHNDLRIMVEGHTDNVPYKGNANVKDNWDLSVMRATAIVKLILKKGKSIDPARIEASGHGEYAPKVPNSTAANKAKNRRTEIILTPNLSDLVNIIK